MSPSSLSATINALLSLTLACTLAQPPLVSLSETYELLRVIEEITAPIELSASGKAPIDIFGDLDMLGRLLEGQVEEGEKNKEGGQDRTTRALGQLKVVREALAR